MFIFTIRFIFYYSWWCFSDRKSTRLNSSHLVISYAVFCLKKKIYIDTHMKPMTMIVHQPDAFPLHDHLMFLATQSDGRTFHVNGLSTADPSTHCFTYEVS